MLCIQHQGGSTGLLQRRLRIGYGRAARVIDQLHAAGVLGPPTAPSPATCWSTSSASTSSPPRIEARTQAPPTAFHAETQRRRAAEEGAASRRRHGVANRRIGDSSRRSNGTQSAFADTKGTSGGR